MANVIAENTDKKGMRIRMLHDVEAHELTVEVYYKGEIKVGSFPGNRWGYQQTDMMKAVALGETFAEEFEKEFV